MKEFVIAVGAVMFVLGFWAGMAMARKTEIDHDYQPDQFPKRLDPKQERRAKANIRRKMHQMSASKPQ